MKENKKAMNEEERTEVVVDIAENFKKCDPYAQGFIAGFINAVQATKNKGNEKITLPNVQAGLQ